MKILITGGSGLLGQYLNIELSRENEILTLYKDNKGNCNQFNSTKLDITDFKSLENTFKNFKPDVVVHTASISSAQKATVLPSALVNKTNISATKKIAELCNELNSKLLYISTDLVYAGYRGSNLDETKKLIPVSLYAESKLMGEVKIKETFDNYLILRLALLFGFGFHHTRSHFHNVYNNLKNNKPIKLFTDQYRSPLSLFEAARFINHLTKVDLKNEVVNVGGPTRISRYDLGKMLCEFTGFNKDLIEKSLMDDVADLPKVEDVSLNTDKLISLGIKQKSIPEALKEILDKKDIVLKTN